MTHVPPLLGRAHDLEGRLGFTRSCLPEVGSLLSVLASGRRVAEIGTGCGVGAAWLASSAAEVVTVEVEPRLAAAAADLFADQPHVQVLAGDWTLLGSLPPFDLVFLDGGPKQAPAEHAESVLALVHTGGLFLLDDLTPGRSGPDPVRAFWLGDGRVRGVELLTTPTTAAILASRV